MLRRLYKKIIDETGQSVIELVITLPILIAILGGIVDFGWIFTNQNIIDQCARSGTRYAIVNSTPRGTETMTDVKTRIKNITRNLAPDNIKASLIIDVTYTVPYSPRSGDVIVSVKEDVKALTPITGLFTQGQTIKLKASCTMKVE